MTIVAKYPSRCASCHGTITPGQQIEWIKGQPARHTRCGSAAVAPATRTAPRRSAAATGTCAYCHRHGVPVRMEHCHEPCPESAVPGQLYEDCDRRHPICVGGCADYTPAEIAEREAARIADSQRREEAAAASARAQGLARLGTAIAEAARGEMLTGLASSESVVMPADATAGERYTLDPSTSLTLYTLSTGERAAMVERHGYDDYRRLVYLPPDALTAALEVLADERMRVSSIVPTYNAGPITPAQAREWVQKYGGCVGADVMRVIASR